MAPDVAERVKTSKHTSVGRRPTRLDCHVTVIFPELIAFSMMNDPNTGFDYYVAVCICVKAAFYVLVMFYCIYADLLLVDSLAYYVRLIVSEGLHGSLWLSPCDLSAGRTQ